MAAKEKRGKCWKRGVRILPRRERNSSAALSPLPSGSSHSFLRAGGEAAHALGWRLRTVNLPSEIAPSERSNFSGWGPGCFLKQAGEGASERREALAAPRSSFLGGCRCRRRFPRPAVQPSLLDVSSRTWGSPCAAKTFKGYSRLASKLDTRSATSECEGRPSPCTDPGACSELGGFPPPLPWCSVGIIVPSLKRWYPGRFLPPSLAGNVAMCLFFNARALCCPEGVGPPPSFFLFPPPPGVSPL